jgi:hypothetical protein
MQDANLDSFQTHSLHDFIQFRLKYCCTHSIISLPIACVNFYVIIWCIHIFELKLMHIYSAICRGHDAQSPCMLNNIIGNGVFYTGRCIDATYGLAKARP